MVKLSSSKKKKKMINTVTLDLTAGGDVMKRGKVVSVWCYCQTKEGKPVTWGFPVIVKSYSELPELLKIRLGMTFTVKGKFDFYRDSAKKIMKFYIIAEEITIRETTPVKEVIESRQNPDNSTSEEY